MMDTDIEFSTIPSAIPLLDKSSISISSRPKEPKTAFTVRDAKFTYGRSVCASLSDVSMSVNVGNSYALLGPSGCGKTTLLNVINGRFKLDKGEVTLFGRSLDKLPIRKRAPLMGFMPQELSQYSQFTIEETVYLYGKLQNMKDSEIKERLESLINLLELPPKHKNVGSISGGQQRRVSLASALIHNPPLLILDEPTVGVDPLLRLKLWKYLTDLSVNNGTTVLLTTHYTEEAKGASKVGLMRNGEILVEGTPTDIMRRFNTRTLEGSFLIVCSQKEKTIKEEENTNEKDVKTKDIKMEEAQEMRKIDCDVLEKQDLNSKNTLKRSYWYSSLRKHKEHGTRLTSHSFSLHDYYLKIKVVLWRNFLFSKKNFPLLIFQIIIPLLTIILISFSVGTKLFDIPIGLVNEEDPPNFSEVFINSLDNETMKLFTYSNIEEGLEAVRSVKVKGLIQIGPEFSECIYNKLHLGLLVDNSTIECSAIRTHFDKTNSVLFGIVHHSILKAYEKFHKQVLHLTGLELDLTTLPIDMSNSTYGYDEEPFSHFVLPGAIVSLSFYMPLLANLFTFIFERRSGVQDRLRVSGVTFNQILLSQFLTQTIIVMLQAPLILIFPISGFKLPMRGSIVLTYILQILTGTIGLTYGFFISALTNNENTAIMIVLATLYTNLSLSGFIWPLESISVILRDIAYYLPITMPIAAQRAMMLKGWDLSYPTVYLGFICTFCWSFGFLILTAIVLKIKREK